MARTNAISLLAGTSTPTTLAELYGLVIENVQKRTLSGALKSQQYTGDPRVRVSPSPPNENRMNKPFLAYSCGFCYVEMYREKQFGPR